MNAPNIDAIVRHALDEDLPDITSEAIFAPSDRGSARFLMKAAGILAALDFAAAIFAAIDPSSSWTAHRRDGDAVDAGETVAEVEALSPPLTITTVAITASTKMIPAIAATGRQR